MPKINFQNIHHFLLYECSPSYDGIPLIQPGDSNRNRQKQTSCPTITLGFVFQLVNYFKNFNNSFYFNRWAVGGDTVNYFPKDTGFIFSLLVFYFKLLYFNFKKSKNSKLSDRRRYGLQLKILILFIFFKFFEIFI